MKNFFFIFFLSLPLFSATSEQIDQYLTISKADSELIAIEQVFDSMKSDEDNTTQEINQIYSLYLEEHFSSNEIETLLALYRTPIMQRYVVEMDMGELPADEMKIFLNSIKETPLSTQRLDIIKNILKHTVNDEQILAFYGSMTQRYKPKKEKSFLEMMKKEARNSLLYGTQVLSLEEMNELNKALKESIISKASKVESDAMIHVMDTFIQGIVAQPKKREESNQTLEKI
jgi:CRISPR/Cas system CSM-associated protein Csm2 small subunit